MKFALNIDEQIEFFRVLSISHNFLKYIQLKIFMIDIVRQKCFISFFLTKWSQTILCWITKF